jgi:hypothetical protein
MTQNPFWYNVDTGEALWDKPDVLLEIEAYNVANEKKWEALPKKPLVHIMRFLFPFPDRTRCSYVCKQWRRAANDTSFVRHVYPAEMGAYSLDAKKMEMNHFRTIGEAVATALPGDTLGTSAQTLHFLFRYFIHILTEFLPLFQSSETDITGRMMTW